MGKFDLQRNFNGFEGLCLIEPRIYEDERGFLFEAYHEKDLSEFHTHFVQDNESFSHKNVLRGFGINVKVPQAKLIRVLSGKIFDVVVDLRKTSNTFMQWSSIELSAKNKKQLFIPEGFAHAFLAKEPAHVLFKVSTHFISGDEVGFLWNSAPFKIDWPIDEEPILSNRDRDLPEFSLEILEQTV